MSVDAPPRAAQKLSHNWESGVRAVRPVGERRKPTRAEKRKAGSTKSKKG